MTTTYTPIELSCDFMPDHEVIDWGPSRQEVVITYPDGGATRFEGNVTATLNGADFSVIPGTMTHEKGPWHKRLAYWLKCRWWQLTGKWGNT